MGRPPLRPSPEPIRDGGIRSDAPRRRRGRNAQHHDDFAVPNEYRKPDMTYEWKRESVLGKEDNAYMAGLRENGWEPVTLADMPVYGREGETGVVRRDGQVLCARPKELTYEAKVEDYQIARQQVEMNQEAMLGKVFQPGVPRKNAEGYKVKYDSLPPDFRTVKHATDHFTVEND